MLTYDSMAIRRLAMASEVFTAIGYPPAKLASILNRADANGGISKADLEEALGQAIDFEIVSDGRLVLTANNEGVPFVSSSPEAPISQGLRQVAGALVAVQSERGMALAGRT